MTAPALNPKDNEQFSHTKPPVLWPVPTPSSDELIRVRTAPLVDDTGGSAGGEGGGPTETVVDMQLIVDYTGALARRTAAAIRDGQVDKINDLHVHPSRVACLRCAVLSTARDRTMAITLLEILDRTNAHEEWNCGDECSDVKMISRLRRLAISSETMASIYGPHWGEVMLTSLRAEHADFELVSHLARSYQPSRVLTVHTRDSLAAYHLAMACAPWTRHDGSTVASMARNAAAVRLAIATASVAVGRPPSWIDHLPAPAL